MCCATFAFLQLSHRSPAEPESRAFCTELGFSLMQGKIKPQSAPHEVPEENLQQLLFKKKKINK